MVPLFVNNYKTHVVHVINVLSGWMVPGMWIEWLVGWLVGLLIASGLILAMITNTCTFHVPLISIWNICMLLILLHVRNTWSNCLFGVCHILSRPNCHSAIKCVESCLPPIVVTLLLNLLCHISSWVCLHMCVWGKTIHCIILLSAIWGHFSL